MDQDTSEKIEKSSDFILRRISLRSSVASILVAAAIAVTVLRASYEISNNAVALHVDRYGLGAVVIELVYVALLDAVLLISAWMLVRRPHARGL